MSGATPPEVLGSVTRGNKKILKTKLLLGEGVDEEVFFTAMLKHLGRDDVQALSYGGKPKLSGFLKLLMDDPKWPEVEAVLITRDADFPNENARASSAKAAWESVTSNLRAFKLPVPREHGKLVDGRDHDVGSTLRVGVFILPDGVSDGMLEDLCVDAVSGDPVKPCLDAYFRCIEEKGAMIPRHRLPKARAHAFLASRSEPDRRVGEAARDGYWPWDAPALGPLLAFVRSA